MNVDPQSAVSFGDVAPWLALGIFGVTFFWCLISFVMSRISGWATLAAAYPAAEVLTPHARYTWQSAFMNGTTRYSAALAVVADAQAVHFSMFPLLKIGHAPFSVPWQDIRAERVQRAFTQDVALTFARASGVSIRITPKLGDRLAAASAGRITVAGATQ